MYIITEPLFDDHDHRGRERTVKQVQYGKAKPSYVMKDGTDLTLVRFDGIDASTASMFLLKFLDKIQNHNMKEVYEY